MTPKERRDRILRDRPHLRPMGLDNPKDIGIVWADYVKNGLWFQPGLNNEQFTESFLRTVAIFDSLWFAEDSNKAFAGGRGPVALVGATTNGWRVEPHIHHFSWSNKRNRLRTVVALLQMMRHDKHVGVCLVLANEADKKFFDGLERYRVLFPSGFVPGGLPDGNAYVYSVKGRKKCLSLQQQLPQSAQSEAQ